MSEQNLCWSDTLSDQLVKIIICTVLQESCEESAKIMSASSRESYVDPAGILQRIRPESWFQKIIFGNHLKIQKGCTVNKRWLHIMSLWSNSHTTVKQQEKIKLSKTQPRLYPQQFRPLVYQTLSVTCGTRTRQRIGMRTESALLYKSDSFSLIWYCRCWLHIYPKSYCSVVL